MATGGAERTASGYAELLRRSGFELLEIKRLPALPSIVVGEAR
jgi:hypothetical protein